VAGRTTSAQAQGTAEAIPPVKLLDESRLKCAQAGGVKRKSLIQRRYHAHMTNSEFKFEAVPRRYVAQISLRWSRAAAWTPAPEQRSTFSAAALARARHYTHGRWVTRRRRSHACGTVPAWLRNFPGEIARTHYVR